MTSMTRLKLSSEARRPALRAPLGWVQSGMVVGARSRRPGGPGPCDRRPPTRCSVVPSASHHPRDPAYPPTPAWAGRARASGNRGVETTPLSWT